METSWPGPAARPSANNSQSWASPVCLRPCVCVLELQGLVVSQPFGWDAQGLVSASNPARG